MKERPILWIPNSARQVPPPIKHELSLAPVACPACDAPAPMTERGFETLIGWMGPHDTNCVEGIFECSAGHRFFAATQHICSCGWSGVK